MQVATRLAAQRQKNVGVTTAARRCATHDAASTKTESANETVIEIEIAIANEKRTGTGREIDRVTSVEAVAVTSTSMNADHGPTSAVPGAEVMIRTETV